MRVFWPAAQAAQVDYETLRAAVVAGVPLIDTTAGRFARGGLAALIAHPHAEPVFAAVLAGARRPAWTPHHDPRLDALAAGYTLLVAAADNGAHIEEVAQ